MIRSSIKHKAALKSGEKKLRTRKCAIKGCSNRFTPRSITHKACGPDCAKQVAEAARIKAARKADAERKLKLKTRSDYLKEAQAAFNAFIRERDAMLPCISCWRFHDGAYDAGHYRSVGSMPSLRFHEDNVHKQCVPCNQHKSGNAVEYRIGLTFRIGRERVEWLEGPHEAAKYTIEDAKRIEAEYKAKLKALKEASC